MILNKRNIIAMAIFQIVLLIFMSLANSYIIHQSDPLIENLKIEQSRTQEIINSGINLLIGFLSIKQIGIVSAESYWCCPETKEGAICQNIPVEDYDSCSETPLQSSCETTSSCQVGICIDKEKGTCSTGTKYRCEEDGGTWDSRSIKEINECGLGCCTLNNGAKKEYLREISCSVKEGVFDSSIPLTECKIDYGDKGACILENMGCKLTTEEDCEKNFGGVFSKGLLCSNPNLETKCKSPSTKSEIKTTCNNNKVYFLDTCGNLANIYDADKWEEEEYWSIIQAPTCNSSLLDKNCGNCNELTSICASSSDAETTPSYGNYICNDLNCNDEYFSSKFGRNPLNGEAWCIYESYVGDGKDVVGSEHLLRYCNRGVVETDPTCLSYRTRICGETTIPKPELGVEDFSVARCRFNEGYKCYGIEMEQYKFDDYGWFESNDKKKQTEEDNEEKCEANFDCQFKSVDFYFNPGLQQGSSSGYSVYNNYKFDICVPEYPPGLEFWDSSSNAKGLCESMNTVSCKTIWQATTSWGNKQTYECKGNCACLSQEYADKMNDLCTSLGDCGAKTNIIGVYTQGGAKIFDMTKDIDEHGDDYVKPEYIETYINNVYEKYPFEGSTRLYGYGKGDISSDEKKEYKSYAERDGEGELPTYLSTSEQGVFGGESLAVLKLLGDPEAWGGTAAIAVAAVAGAVILILIVALGNNPIGIIIDVIIAVVAALIIAFLALFGTFDDPVIIEVEFKCEPWQAPTGGSDCDKCDDDPLIPCTEYRCRSLGASCGILEDAYESENPVCINKYPNDVTPPEILFDRIEEDYTNEKTTNGIQIRGYDGGCIQEFSLINFTLKTEDGKGNDDYARCVYNWMSGVEAPTAGNDYALSGDTFKEGTFYSVNHTFSNRLPFLFDSDKISKISGDIGERQGELNMYIRCMDYAGNSNFNEYIVNFCIKEGPDTTPAEINSYNPKDKSYLAYKVNESSLNILLNEPAKCKWTHDTDKPYEEMENNMVCDDYNGKLTKLEWGCSTLLTNLDEQENKIYIKCKDQPWISKAYYDGPWTEEDRNINIESFEYSLYATQSELKINLISPQGEITKGPIFSSEINLLVTTSGGAYDGSARCKYEFLEPHNGGDSFFETGTTQHKQPLNPPTGDYTVLIKCEDEAGNEAEGNAIFNLITDTDPPNIVRAYKDGSNLKIITDEEAKCYYDFNGCSFNMENSNSITTAFSVTHSIKWDKGLIYYIKCKDIFENINQDCTKKIIASS